MLADRAYHSKTKFKAARAINAIPIVANNPTKKDKSHKTESDVLLKTKRYVVEQFNGLIKDNVLGECWFWPRGLVKKAVMVLAGLVCLDANVVEALVERQRACER